MPRPPPSPHLPSSYFASVPPEKKRISRALLRSAFFLSMIFFVLNRFETSKPLDLMSIAQREETSLPEEIVDDEGMTHTIGGGGGGDAGGEEDEDGKGGEFNLKDSIVPLNSDSTYCNGAPGAWFARAEWSTKRRLMREGGIGAQKKSGGYGAKIWDAEANKFCSSPVATRRRRSLLGFSDEQCSQTCRSVERDHKELLSERKRQAREDLLDCLTSDAGCKKVFSSKKERWENMAKFAFALPSVKMLTEFYMTHGNGVRWGTGMSDGAQVSRV